MVEIAELIRVGNLRALERGFDQLTQSIYEQDPLISPLGYYQEVAKTLPYFIPSRTQERMFRAAASPSADVSRRAKGLILLVNLDTILTASSRFFRANDEDFNGELVQHSLTEAFSRIDRFSRDYMHAGFLHTAVHNASSAFVGQADNIPADWLRRGVAETVLGEISESNASWQIEIDRECLRIAQTYNVSEDSVAAYMRLKLGSPTGVLEDQTHKDYTLRSILDVLKETLKNLPEPARTAFLIRYFSDPVRVIPHAEIAKRMGIQDPETIRKREYGVLRVLRKTPELISLQRGEDFTIKPVRYMGDKTREVSEELEIEPWYYRVKFIRPQG